ncbi:MAG: hypothetical protein ACK4ZJ_19065, partial [Allorhizobium sp.]
MGERSCVMAGSGQREAAATAAVLDSLSLRMSIVCAHCRCAAAAAAAAAARDRSAADARGGRRHVDELEEELLEVASPHSLWWFRDTLDKVRDARAARAPPRPPPPHCLARGGGDGRAPRAAAVAGAVCDPPRP